MAKRRPTNQSYLTRFALCRARTHTVNHSGVAKINYQGRKKTMSFMKIEDDDFDHGTLEEPEKPLFKTMLTSVGINALKEAGHEYLTALRDMWDPKTTSSYVDDEGKVRFKEMPTFQELGMKVALRQVTVIRDEAIFT